jgi:hypothetical protein
MISSAKLGMPVKKRLRKTYRSTVKYKGETNPTTAPKRNTN